jgi:hypothetical protein
MMERGQYRSSWFLGRVLTPIHLGHLACRIRALARIVGAKDGIADHVWSLGELIDPALAIVPPDLGCRHKKPTFTVIEGGREEYPPSIAVRLTYRIDNQSADMFAYGRIVKNIFQACWWLGHQPKQV